jgi:hypothetical protein
MRERCRAEQVPAQQAAVAHPDGTTFPDPAKSR